MSVSGASDASYRLSLPGLARTGAAQRAAGAAAAAAPDGVAAGGRGPDGVGRPEGLEGVGEAKGPSSFGDAIRSALDAVDQDVQGGDRLVQKAVRGESVETHELMMALEKADLSVRLMTQVGRRAVDAYREIMRMNV